MKKITTPSRSEVGKKLKTLSCVLPLATALTFSSCDSTPTTLPELKAKWENVK
ncbi:MAG: hypothetical protein LBD11_05860 [Candidatus Peribacteria bacterium]|jgi:hypothetical protein|nr:hypothetical protein [Candidatus Peribacteria bacterium]